MNGAKRAFDFLMALVSLLLLAPLLAVLAIAVRMDSPGPAFFRQKRVGRYGRPFRIVKLRSMSIAPGERAQITRLGRHLRQYKLDELPQLINVIKGEMSLVGPRPELPEFVALYQPEDRDRILAARPGITDPASLEYFDEDAMLAAAPDPERLYVELLLPAKLKISLRYLKDRSFMRDIAIIAQTVAQLFRSRAHRDRLGGKWIAR